MDYLEVLKKVHKRPYLYFGQVTFNVIVAFFLGFDLALNGKLLEGFREWLVVKINGDDNLLWDSLVLRHTFPDEENPSLFASKSQENENIAIDKLFNFFFEFSEERPKPVGDENISR